MAGGNGGVGRKRVSHPNYLSVLFNPFEGKLICVPGFRPNHHLRLCFDAENDSGHERTLKSKVQNRRLS